MNFTEKEILTRLDLAHSGIPCADYPVGKSGDIKYNFFLDLEHGYCEVAGSRIHLYGDSIIWAIVFELNGYHNRRGSADIELYYIGNCIDYPISKYPERNYITNSTQIVLISPEEYERITNKEGTDMELFELISSSACEVKIRNSKIKIEHDFSKYESLGIELRDYDNPNNLIGFGDLIRYIHETNPTVINATEEEIEMQIPKDIPKLMTIDQFHFLSAYKKDNPSPSKQETFQLIAKVLVSGDMAFWKPTLKPNNHWTNWESGSL
ncbi:MAG: hypothetical protein ABI723_18175 [Bacteroidia bacterium]